MKPRFLIYFCAALLMISTSLFFYIEKRNHLTQLRIEIPRLTQEFKNLQEENTRLTYEVERFESPLHLMQLAREPRFGHLCHPYLTDVSIVQIQKEDVAEQVQ